MHGSRDHVKYLRHKGLLRRQRPERRVFSVFSVFCILVST